MPLSLHYFSTVFQLIRKQSTTSSSRLRGQLQPSASNTSITTSGHVDVVALEPVVESIVEHVTPVLRQAAGTLATLQVLAYVRKLVVTLCVAKCGGELADAPDAGQPRSTQFFKRQLTSILDDTLNKYVDQPIDACQEDIVADVSEAIFNEMAFYRLMNNLQDGQSSVGGKVSRSLSSIKCNFCSQPVVHHPANCRRSRPVR